MGVSEGKGRGEGAAKIFKEIIAENAKCAEKH